jgi:thiamine pyrophosphate-dependent acetolactate synthase large subunit-like protein
MKTGAELVVQTLADAGVKYVFGIGGDSVIALIDAIDRTPGIQYMLRLPRLFAGHRAYRRA